MTLNKVIFRHFLRGALVPILVIELALIVMYFSISQYTFRATQAEMVASALEQLQRVTSLEASMIDSQLRGVADLGKIIQQDQTQFFSDPNACYLPNGEPQFDVHL